MFGLIARLLIVAVAMLLASEFIPGITVEAFWPTAVIAAVVFGVLNTLVKPVLAILTLPITLLTLGLFMFVLNALMFWLLGFIDGVSVAGFVPAFLGALLVSIISWVASKFL